MSRAKRRADATYLQASARPPRARDRGAAVAALIVVVTAVLVWVLRPNQDRTTTTPLAGRHPTPPPARPPPPPADRDDRRPPTPPAATVGAEPTAEPTTVRRRAPRAVRGRADFPLDPFQQQALDALDAGRTCSSPRPPGRARRSSPSTRSSAALAAGAKAFYTTPLKALSNQKYGDLVRVHGATASACSPATTRSTATRRSW